MVEYDRHHAEGLWRGACAALEAEAALAGDTWGRLNGAAPADDRWHSLGNCVAYQAEIWQNLQLNGSGAVTYPEAFVLAMVLRHTPTELAGTLLTEVLRNHSLASEMHDYALSLLSDDNPWSACNGEINSTGTDYAPPRDKRLFSDCELAVMAAPREEYDLHATLMRDEYAHLPYDNYAELRIKILRQFSQLPKLYQSPEFERFEATARANIERELRTLRQR